MMLLQAPPTELPPTGLPTDLGEATERMSQWAEYLLELAKKHGPSLVAAIVILVLGWLGAKVITGFVRRGLRKAKFDETLTKFLCNLIYMLLLAFVIVAAITKVGVEATSFVAILGAAGFAVGFALQGSLSNFASGVLLIMLRPFKAGDYVEAGGVAGTIVEVGVFSTVFKTPDNKRIIVANGAVMGGNIINYSAHDTRRVDMVFGIGYGDDIKLAKETLQKIMDEDPRVLKDPAVTIAVAELGDSSVNIVCRPWVKTADYWGVHADTHEKVKLTFDAKGITIPFPQRDVHLHQVA